MKTFYYFYLVAVVLLSLKLAAVISISWVWVLAPVWGYWVGVALLYLVVHILYRTDPEFRKWVDHKHFWNSYRKVQERRR